MSEKFFPTQESKEKEPHLEFDEFLKFDFAWRPTREADDEGVYVRNDFGEKVLSRKMAIPADHCDLGWAGSVQFKDKSYDAYATRLSSERLQEGSVLEHAETGIFTAQLMTKTQPEAGRGNEILTMQLLAGSLDRDDPESENGRFDYFISEYVVRGPQFRGRHDESADFKGVSPACLKALLREVQRITSEVKKNFRHDVTNTDPRPAQRDEGVHTPQEKWDAMYASILQEFGYQLVGQKENGTKIWRKDYINRPE